MTQVRPDDLLDDDVKFLRSLRCRECGETVDSHPSWIPKGEPPSRCGRNREGALRSILVDLRGLTDEMGERAERNEVPGGLALEDYARRVGRIMTGGVPKSEYNPGDIAAFISNDMVALVKVEDDYTTSVFGEVWYLDKSDGTWHGGLRKHITKGKLLSAALP